MVVLKNKEKFFAITEKFEYVPYTQTEGWYNYLACTQPKPSEKFIFLIDNTDNPAIACFGFIMKFGWLKMLVIEGECLKSLPINRKTIQSFYEEITKLNFDFVEINSHSHYTPEFEIGIRKADYLRPAGLFSNHLSKLIDLRKPIEYGENWKRNIRRAKKYGLIFNFIENPSAYDINIFIDLYKKLLDKKKFSNQSFNIKQINQLLNTNYIKLAIVSDINENVISVMIFSQINYHGQSIFSATMQEAKSTGAAFLMYVQLFEYLKNKGLLFFDMGRLASSSLPSLKGVFDFKDGIYGEYVIYNGEYSWYKKQFYRPLMYFVKKYLLKKREA